MKKLQTCGGACCRRFIISKSPEELKEEYEAWLRAGPGSSFQYLGMTGKLCANKLGGNNERYVSIHAEIYLIYPMLVYLGAHNWDPATGPSKRYPKGHSKSHHYTCKHHDAKTGLCSIYEIRPYMCRRYPNGDSCPWPGCKHPGNEKRKKEEARKVKVEEVRKVKAAVPYVKPAKRKSKAHWAEDVTHV